MSQHISAVFGSRQASLDARDRLLSEGFSVVRHDIVAGAGLAGPGNDTPPADEQREDWILVASAPFGSAQRAIQIMKLCGAVLLREERGAARRSHGTQSHGVESERSAVQATADQSFFVSSVLGLPLLVECPAPLSSLLGLPTLLTGD